MLLFDLRDTPSLQRHDLVGDDIELLDNDGEELEECPEVEFADAFFNPDLSKVCGVASVLK